MNLDILVGVCVLVGGWLGYSTGIMTQLGKLANVVLAAVLGRVMVVPIAGFYMRMTDATVETTVAMIFAICYGIAWFVIYLGISRLTEEASQQGDPGGGDRFGGALVGGIKGLAFAFVIGSVVVTVGMGKGRDPDTYREEARMGASVVDKNLLVSAIDTVVRKEASEDRPTLRGWERGEDWSED